MFSYKILGRVTEDWCDNIRKRFDNVISLSFLFFYKILVHMTKEASTYFLCCKMESLCHWIRSWFETHHNRQIDPFWRRYCSVDDCFWWVRCCCAAHHVPPRTLEGNTEGVTPHIQNACTEILFVFATFSLSFFLNEILFLSFFFSFSFFISINTKILLLLYVYGNFTLLYSKWFGQVKF